MGCTADLKIKYASENQLRIEEGSVDIAYLKSLGNFDVVYAWGVLHHTGAMAGTRKYGDLVNPGGKYLFQFIMIGLAK